MLVRFPAPLHGEDGFTGGFDTPSAAPLPQGLPPVPTAPSLPARVDVSYPQEAGSVKFSVNFTGM